MGEGFVLVTTRFIAALLVCSLPLAAGAKPVGTFEFIVAQPGDQVDPAIDGQYVVFTGPGPAGHGLDVFLYDIQTKTLRTIAGGPGDQDSPDVYLSTAIYRSPLGIVIVSWPTGQVLRAPPAGGDGVVSRPVVHSAVAAWETQSAATGYDIVVSRYLSGAPPYVLRAPGDLVPTGDQHAPAVYDDLVAYVDDARQGSVWLHDSSRGRSNWTQICGGRATGVSIGWDGTRYVIAVARDAGTGTGEDIEIYDRDGVLLASLPAAGPQRNPHVAGEWVAFDDTSGVNSQVAAWRWKTPPGEANLVFVPHPSTTDQRLNDTSLVIGEELRIVFEDSMSVATGRDIALFRLPVNPIVYDAQANGWPIAAALAPARCDDPTATPLATLDLTREAGAPDEGTVAFDVAPSGGAHELPVLVCIRAEHVSSAWVLLGEELVARPDDFEPRVTDLSRPAVVERGTAHLSARLHGKPGSRLTVRVLPDPARITGCRSDDRRREDGERDGDDEGKGSGGEGREGGGGSCPGTAAGPAVRTDPPAHESAADRAGGCGNAGGVWSLASLAALLARRRRRV